jgi:norsolorinic acid ketoreductase
LAHGLPPHLSLPPYSTCIAAVRDPFASNAILTSLQTGTGSKLIVTKINSSVATNAGDAIEDLQDTRKIDRIDVVGENTFFPEILI